MTITPEPIRKRKLAEDVEERLLTLIREQGLSPGEKLPSERELMHLYQVGRPAIREAMQNLQRMGLVEIKHGERPRVAEPSMEGILEQMDTSMRHMLTHSVSSLVHLKEARATFEAEMAKLAAERRSDKDIEELSALLAAQSAVRALPEKFLEFDGLFHRRIAAISKNPIFETVSFAMFNWLKQFHSDLVRKPGLEELTLDEHRQIVEAIRCGEGEAASTAMRNHLNRANTLYHRNHSSAQSNRKAVGDNET